MAISEQIFRFLLTGGIATALHYLTLAVCVYVFQWSAWLGSGIGYLAGSVISYMMNYFFTFGSALSHNQAVPRFYFAVAIGWALNTSVIALLVEGMSWNPWLAQVFSTLIVITWNFTAARLWVFRLS